MASWSLAQPTASVMVERASEVQLKSKIARNSRLNTTRWLLGTARRKHGLRLARGTWRDIAAWWNHGLARLRTWWDIGASACHGKMKSPCKRNQGQVAVPSECLSSDCMLLNKTTPWARFTINHPSLTPFLSLPQRLVHCDHWFRMISILPPERLLVSNDG